jgi:hypothetical protein
MATRATQRKSLELRELSELFRHRAFERVGMQIKTEELGE